MAETIYKIKDWNETFENNRTRTLDHPRYVNWPTKAGEAFLCLTRTAEGTIAFGVFGVLVQWMARRGKRQLRDGVLRDDRGPFGPERYSRTYGLPLEQAKQAWLLLQKEGWLVESDGQVTVNCPSGDAQVTVECPSSDGQVTAYCPSSDLGEERRGVDRRVKDKTPAATRKPRRAVGGDAVSPRFIEFWQAFPSGIPNRKQDRKKCSEVWAAKKLDDQADRILADVKAKRTGEKWTKDKGAFIEAPLVYLNNERWMDQDAPGSTFDWKGRWQALPDQTRQEWTQAFRIETKDRQTRPGEFGEWVSARLERVGGAA